MADDLNVNKRTSPIYSNPLLQGQRLKKNTVEGGQDFSNQDFSNVVKKIQLEISEKAGEGIRISAHARKRIDGREIHFDSKTAQTLDNVLNLARDKGSKNTLAMIDNQAFLLSVRDRTLITAMSNEEMQSRFFTNVDSVYINGAGPR